MIYKAPKSIKNQGAKDNDNYSVDHLSIFSCIYWHRSWNIYGTK